MKPHPECQCRKRVCDAKIRLPDGQAISRGLLKLGAFGGAGHFVPAPVSSPKNWDSQAVSEVVADMGSHQHRLLGWKYVQDSVRLTEDGMVIGNYFEFYSDEALPSA
jgi:hypothetical protein